MLVLVTLAVVACGDSEPLPDIVATVEAGIELAKVSLVTPIPAQIPHVVVVVKEIVPTADPAPTLPRRRTLAG